MTTKNGPAEHKTHDPKMPHNKYFLHNNFLKLAAPASNNMIAYFGPKVTDGKNVAIFVALSHRCCTASDLRGNCCLSCVILTSRTAS